MSRILRPLMAMSLSMALGACIGPFRDRGEPYRQAQDAPPLQMPAGVETRPLHDVYPVPMVPGKPVWDSKGTDLPAPRPLKLDQSAQIETKTVSDVRWQLIMGQDGNGFPVLDIRGAGFDQTWDQLVVVARQLHLPMEDQNRSLGLVYLKLGEEVKDKKTVPLKGQLKLTRGIDSWQLSLQKDDDNMAPVEKSRELLNKILEAWPKPAA